LFLTIKAGFLATGRQMGDQATSGAAAGTQPLSSSRSKEQSASAAAAVPPGQWEQMFHLWQCLGHYAKNCPRNKQRQMSAPSQDKGRKQ
jgi:hypothetical protein